MRIATKVALSFVIPISLIAFLGVASYNTQAEVVETIEYNELMYAPAAKTSIMIIDDFTLLQDIIQYNPDVHTREEYLATVDRLMIYYDDYREAINARGSDGQYILSNEKRSEFLGYADKMEEYTILFDEQARKIIDIREDPQLSPDEKSVLVSQRMPFADEPMWQFWYYLDVAKDTAELDDLRQRQELSQSMIASNETMTLLLILGVAASAGIAFVNFRGITGRIGILRKSAELIGRQDYRTPVKVSGNDEMTLLAQDLEAMRQKVESYDLRLTTTVRERTKELEKTHGELKRRNKELELANALMRETDKIKDEFINVAAHELRTPIQPILTYGELAQEGLVSQEEAWAVVTRQTNRLKNLANDILDVSRIDGGNLILKRKELDINTLVRSLAKVMIPEKDLTLELRLEETDGVKVFVDESRLLQVLTNLIGNSIKFTEKGVITIETKKLEGDKIELAVRDTGPGIPSEILPRLFSKFATRDVSETSKNGTGLGLYICKGIIEAHGGTIEGANASEGGAMLRLVLPINVSQSGTSQVPRLETRSKKS